MKLLKTVSNLSLAIENKKKEIFVLEETLKLENEIKSRIDFEKLHDCLEKLKLGVDKQVSFHLQANQFGLYGYFNLCLIPLEGCSIKKLSWKGYDSKGASKNSKSRDKKAKDLSEKIESMTGLKIDVNTFSFEYDRYSKENERFYILCNFFVY